jgi:hypothetical protein
MNWSDIPRIPSQRKLRQFAGLFFLTFGWLACWESALARDKKPPFAFVFGLMAVSIGLAGLIKPQWIRPIFVGWMILVFPLGWVISRLVLATVYYGLFTPLGLLFRLLGRDPLHLRDQPGQISYWIAKPVAEDVRGYFRQF